MTQRGSSSRSAPGAGRNRTQELEFATWVLLLAISPYNHCCQVITEISSAPYYIGITECPERRLAEPCAGPLPHCGFLPVGRRQSALDMRARCARAVAKIVMMAMVAIVVAY